MIPKECKRLAEMDFPIAEVSRHAAREKSIRHGHPSTLHLWWARRPLASSRAVLMALLLPDPCDEHCPEAFKQKAREILLQMHGRPSGWTIAIKLDEGLRQILLKFIADFANWDNAANQNYLGVGRGLVKAAHGEEPPLVVDPFAGGGSIPLEALRLGCEAFASDLNPVACLILKVMLEDIPRHGLGLAEELRKVGGEIKRQAERELADLYPTDPDGATPIAYLWARTVRCEAPNCGAEIPLMRSFWLCKKAKRKCALRTEVVRTDEQPPQVEFEVFEPEAEEEVQGGTVTRAKATCVCCSVVLAPERVRAQLAAQKGGADAVFDEKESRLGGARMTAVVTLKPGMKGRHYRLPTDEDYEAVRKAQLRLFEILAEWERSGKPGLCPVPDEPLPPIGTLGFRVQRYGMLQWGDLFTARQKVALVEFGGLVACQSNSEITNSARAMAVGRCADYWSSGVIWAQEGEFVAHTFGRQALPIVWDFAEAVPWTNSSGNLEGAIDWIARVVEAWPGSSTGQVQSADATDHPLPDQTAGIWFTDPPYYDAIPYSDLSDFFLVWLKRTLSDHAMLLDPFNPDNPLSPKRAEAVQDETKQVDGRPKDREWFEETMLGELAAIFPERFKTETLELAQFAAGNLSRNGKSGDVLACDGLQGFPATSVDALEQWRGLAGLFLTGLGTRRQRLTKNEGFPATDRGRTAKERLNAIELDDAVVERLHAVRSFPPPRFEAAQWDMLGALLVLLPIAVSQLRLVFQHEGRVDFTEIAISARIALGTDAEPTDLAFAIDCQIQHLLVDEFQDTSQSQYELLTRLVGEWQPGDGRTLFLVGDPMQSIYGFREADVGLFLRARTEGVGPVVLTPLTLSVNFRSTAGVVDWVNRVLGTAFPSVENRFTGAVTYEPSVPFRTESDEDAVCVHAFLASDLDLEAERVLEIIGETRTQHPDGTIAVLVRSRSHLFGIVSALRRSGERFSAVEIDALGERPVVGDLVALTRALLHPADRIAWLSLLRAPWCGLTLADLHALVDGDFNGPIWDILKTGEWQTRLSPDGIRRLERLIPVLSDAIDRRGTLAVPRWVEGVWIAIAGPACLETRADLEAAAAYLDLLEQSMVGLDIRDERKFADDIARLFAPSDVEAGDGLQLLTVHKAKGLEFDTVILPGLGRRTRTDDQRLLMWLEYMSGGEPRLLLAPIHKVGVNKDPIYDYLRKVHATKSGQESTRLLYVAATRARRRLHLLGHTRLNQDGKAFKAPDPRAVLSKIWGAVEADFVEAFRGVDGEDARFPKHAELAGIPLRRLSLDWTAPAPPEDIAWNAASPSDSEEVGVHRPVFEWASELQRRVGIVVHRMLQEVQAREELAVREDTLRVALRSEGLDGKKLDEALTRAGVALENVVADERGRWILSGHEDDQREYTLSTVVERKVRHFVLDRTFVDDGVRWIIDYKTSTHEGSGRDAFLDNEQTRYREQMESYACVMRTLDPRPIRLGLYFPLVQGWREWAFEEAAASSI